MLYQIQEVTLKGGGGSKIFKAIFYLTHSQSLSYYQMHLLKDLTCQIQILSRNGELDIARHHIPLKYACNSTTAADLSLGSKSFIMTSLS